MCGTEAAMSSSSWKAAARVQAEEVSRRQAHVLDLSRVVGADEIPRSARTQKDTKAWTAFPTYSTVHFTRLHAPSLSFIDWLLAWSLRNILFARVRVCVCVSLCMCVCVCLCVCVRGCLFVCPDACLIVCLFACLPACLLACLLVCLFVCLYVCLFVCVEIHFSSAFSMDDDCHFGGSSLL